MEAHQLIDGKLELLDDGCLVGVDRHVVGAEERLAVHGHALVRRSVDDAVERHGEDVGVDFVAIRDRLTEGVVAPLEVLELLLLAFDVVEGVLDCRGRSKMSSSGERDEQQSLTRRDVDDANLDDLGPSKNRRERVFADENLQGNT